MKSLIVAILLICSIFGLWDQKNVDAQESTPSNLNNEIALLAVSPPPMNAGVLDLYKFHDSEVNIQSTTIQGYPLSAIWSPDGSKLVFIMITRRDGSDAPPSDFDIYSVDRQGNNLVKLTDTPDCPEIGLTWPTGSNYFYFSGFCRGNQSTMFWRLDPNNGSLEKLGEVLWDATWALWSPDARYIALLAPRKAIDGSSFNEANLVSSDGQAMTNLVDDAHPGYQLQQSTILTWSPQGDWLAYATSAQKTEQGLVNQIALVTPDGSEHAILFTSQAEQECLNPVWSPDGKRVAFTCGKSLYSIQTDGSDLRILTNRSAAQAIEYPVWSPDGKSLAFISLDSDGKRRLESIQADGNLPGTVTEIEAIQIFGLVWNPVPQIINPDSSLNPISTEEGQVIPTTSPTADVKQTGFSTSDKQSGNNLSSLWLLGLLLIAGVAGVIVLLSRTGKLPNIVRQEEQRKLRRERREQERLSRLSPRSNLGNEFTNSKKTKANLGEDQISVGQESDSVSQIAGLLRQGIEQVRNKDIQNGINTLRQYLELAPDDPNAWLWLGWAFGLIKEYRTAERCFLRAERLGSSQANEALEWLNNQHK